MRIAVGGFQHETNTFAPVQADFEEFQRGDAWPKLCIGDELFDEIIGVHIPITGGVGVLKEAGADLHALCWCSATPSAHVTEDAFERISAIMLERLAEAGPIDGIYLDLHGAMVCEHFEDGEGELLRRIRAQVGPDLPITVSLDLHANVTPEMVENADLIDIYRHYPHTDMAETGARAAAHLVDIIRNGRKPAKAFRQTDFLIPLQWGCTFQEPAQTLYGADLVAGLERPGVSSLSFACGFPLSDIHHCGPAVVAYADSQEQADAAADAMIGAVQAAEPAFAGRVYEPGEAVRLGHNAAGARPIVLADSQDNPGGGGPGDTTGMLRALLEERRDGCLVGVFMDPETAEQAHAAGGRGGYSGPDRRTPFPG